MTLSSLILFSYTQLIPLVRKLYRGYKDPSKVKKKIKALGGYSSEDPLRTLQMRESIYSLAFAVNLKTSKLEEFGISDEAHPNSMTRAEVSLTAVFCAFCQGFISWLLLNDFLDQN